eukprot:1759353-Alexandrium_andersonii.AAC.1
MGRFSDAPGQVHRRSLPPGPRASMAAAHRLGGPCLHLFGSSPCLRAGRPCGHRPCTSGRPLPPGLGREAQLPAGEMVGR